MDIEIPGRALTTLPADDDHPYRTGPWRSQTVERKADDLNVIGEIPADLDGVYLRNTENPVHPAIKVYDPFDGDGMVHVVGLGAGRRSTATGSSARKGSRWSSRQARAVDRLGREPRQVAGADRLGRPRPDEDASSTDVVMHNGVALTGFYQYGDLYRLNPTTLETLGKATPEDHQLGWMVVAERGKLHPTRDLPTVAAAGVAADHASASSSEAMADANSAAPSVAVRQTMAWSTWM